MTACPAMENPDDAYFTEKTGFAAESTVNFRNHEQILLQLRINELQLRIAKCI